MIKVDHDIPLPPSRNNGAGPKDKYPWAYMEVGYSFLFPEGMTQAEAASVCRGQFKRSGMKFTTRKLSDGRIRVWRTE